MTFMHELFESIAQEIGDHVIEAVYDASILEILILTCIIIAIGWHFRPTFYPYDEYPRIHRPVLSLPWSKSVGESLRDGYNDVLISLPGHFVRIY